MNKFTLKIDLSERGHEVSINGRKIDLIEGLIELFILHPVFYEILKSGLIEFELFKKSADYNKLETELKSAHEKE